MTVKEILSQAMLISGMGMFDDSCEDTVAEGVALAVFRNTLNDMNSDPKITLWQETWDYQRDRDGNSIAKPSKPGNIMRSFQDQQH